MLRQLREVGEEFGSVVCAGQVEDVVDLVVAELDVSRGGHLCGADFVSLKLRGPVVVRWVRYVSNKSNVYCVVAMLN